MAVYFSDYSIEIDLGICIEKMIIVVVGERAWYSTLVDPPREVRDTKGVKHVNEYEM
jgi:hypothetical protein